MSKPTDAQLPEISGRLSQLPGPTDSQVPRLSMAGASADGSVRVTVEEGRVASLDLRSDLWSRGHDAVRSAIVEAVNTGLASYEEEHHAMLTRTGLGLGAVMQAVDSLHDEVNRALGDEFESVLTAVSRGRLS